MSLSNLPTIRPSLLLDFQKAEVVDSRVTFTRASTATRFNSYGVLESVANNVPRIDFNPTTLVSQGLLIEESRTNSIRNNTMVGAAVGTPGTLPTNWGVFASNGLTTTVVATGTNNGISYIDLRFSGTSSSTFYVLAFDSVAASASVGQAWTESFWVSLVGGSTTNISSLNVNLRQAGSATPTFDTSFTPTSSFTRVVSTGTLITGATGVFAALSMGFNSGVAIDITLRIGLPQLEQGAFATSVIPTSTVAVTRQADVASMTGTNFSSWYNAVEGTINAQFQRAGSSNSGAVAGSNDGSSNNRIQIRATNATAIDNFIVLSGVVGFVQTATVVANSAVKSVLAYKANDVNSAVNGVAGTTDTSETLPSGLNTFSIGNIASSGFFNGYIQRISYYPARLTNAQLQALTAT